jgi:hypothetical protein
MKSGLTFLDSSNWKNRALAVGGEASPLVVPASWIDFVITSDGRNEGSPKRVWRLGRRMTIRSASRLQAQEEGDGAPRVGACPAFHSNLTFDSSLLNLRSVASRAAWFPLGASGHRHSAPQEMLMSLATALTIEGDGKLRPRDFDHVAHAGNSLGRVGLETFHASAENRRPRDGRVLGSCPEWPE